MEPTDKSYSLTCNVNGLASVGMSDILGTESKYATLRYDASKGLLDTTYQGINNRIQHGHPLKG